MSAYKVGTSQMGVRVWWDWQGANFASSHTDVRDATEEEAALMEKVCWDRDTPADQDRLRELILLPVPRSP